MVVGCERAGESWWRGASDPARTEMGPSCRWCPRMFRWPRDVEAHERYDRRYEFEVAQNPEFIGKGKLLRVCDSCFVRSVLRMRSLSEFADRRQGQLAL